jgi:hypothetical protein
MIHKTRKALRSRFIQYSDARLSSVHLYYSVHDKGKAVVQLGGHTREPQPQLTCHPQPARNATSTYQRLPVSGTGEDAALRALMAITGIPAAAVNFTR